MNNNNYSYYYSRPQFFIIIWAALVIHLIQALIMLYIPDGDGAIDVSAILKWIPLEYAPAVLISASGAAFIGLLDIDLPWYGRLSLLLPQQALIAMSVYGVIVAVMNNSYADGTPKPGIHIFNDQLWLVGYFFIHAYSVTRRASI